MAREVTVFARIYARRRFSLALNGASALAALAISALAARHFAVRGWPLAEANVRLVAAAVLLFLLGYAFKAYGWQRLFAPQERPQPLALAASCGAASVTGAALPGRFDDIVRIAVVRRCPGPRPGVAALCLSLVMLGLIDTVALTPLASAAAATSEASAAVRVGLAVVAFAGLAAAALVLALPRLAASCRLARFRVIRWLQGHAVEPRAACQAAILVLLSWLVRAAGLVLLLGAVGVGLSFSLAIAFLAAAAASGALPVAPAGAATQAGAGAAVL
ncbi:MAG: lysylphosphatidylglycerol synthase domain-containing protein, partial [Actinomycetota bacterium]|nr:lysylphosphatidylglycerol synthase domain-containing protein [Actinomycetota bacterium]